MYLNNNRKSPAGQVSMAQQRGPRLPSGRTAHIADVLAIVPRTVTDLDDLITEIFAATGRLAIATGSDRLYRFYVLLLALSRRAGGTGKVRLDVAYLAGLMEVNQRTIQRLIDEKHSSDFFYVSGPWLILRSQLNVHLSLVRRARDIQIKVAYHCHAITGRVLAIEEALTYKVKITGEMLRSQKQFNAAIFNGWFSTRSRQETWDHLIEYFNVSRYALRSWMEALPVRKEETDYSRPTLARPGDGIDSQALGFSYCEVQKDGRLHWQGGNRYSGTLPVAARGQAIKINQELKQITGDDKSAQTVSIYVESLRTTATQEYLKRCTVARSDGFTYWIDELSGQRMMQAADIVKTHYSRKTGKAANRQNKRIRKLQAAYPALDFFMETQRLVTLKAGKVRAVRSYELIQRLNLQAAT